MASTQTYEQYPQYQEHDHFSSERKLFTTLEVIRAKSVLPLDVAPIVAGINHQGDMSSTISPPAQDGIHLDRSLYEGLRSMGKQPQRVDFIPLPLQAIGREDSRNKVMFGNIKFTNFTGSSDQRINVAVKPYVGPDSTKRAMHEYAMNEHITRRGISCPTQLGIVKNGTSLYALSEFVPQIVTLDSLDWHTLPQSVGAAALARGLESLFDLHSIGIFHGDYEFKNIPIQPELNESWAVDFEYSLSLAGEPDKVYEPGGILDLLRQDLQMICKSLVDFGLIDPDGSSSEKFQTQYDLILSQYRKIASNKMRSGVFAHHIKQILDIVDCLFFMEAQGDNATEMMRSSTPEQLGAMVLGAHNGR